MHRIYYAHAHFSDLDLDARWQWVVKGKTFLTTKQATSIKFATTVDHFLVCELDFENVYKYGLIYLFFWFSGGDSVQHMSRVDSCHAVHGNHGGEWGDCHHWVWAVCGLQGLCCLAAVCWPILRQSRGRQTCPLLSFQISLLRLVEACYATSQAKITKKIKDDILNTLLLTRNRLRLQVRLVGGFSTCIMNCVLKIAWPSSVCCYCWWLFASSNVTALHSANSVVRLMGLYKPLINK